MRKAALLALLHFAAVCVGTAMAQDWTDLFKNDRPAEAAVLRPEVAFRPSIVEATQNNIVIEWTIEPGHYLYRDAFSFELSGKKARSLGKPKFPAPELIEDPHYGKAPIFRDRVAIELPVLGTPLAADTDTELIVGYQGCVEGRLCYPPLLTRLPIR